jgi:hypothetical protein
MIRVAVGVAACLAAMLMLAASCQDEWNDRPGPSAPPSDPFPMRSAWQDAPKAWGFDWPAIKEGGY